MDLTDVPGVTPEIAGGLVASGVASVADLARSQLAPPDLVAAAQERIVDSFARAGAGTEAALADADPDALAAATGLARADVAWFQAAAREALALTLDTRVVLVDGNPTADVCLPEGKRLGVPILTARAREDPAVVLSSTTGNAVLLREGATAALVRVDGVVHEALPLFRLRPDGSERRVRVQEIRERATKEKGRSLFARMIGR